jgi:hypothetical protein
LSRPELARVRVALLILCLCLPLWCEQEWSPKSSSAIIVGLLEWKDSKAWKGWDKANRRDQQLVGALQKLGMPAENILYLKDQQATRSQILSKISSHLKKTGPGSTLWVYYCGHGYLDEQGTFYWVPYDGYETETLISLPQLRQALSPFTGSRIILAADCCHSGALAQWGMPGSDTWGSLYSTSKPSQSTGNWTFSDCLLDVFKGQPTADHNRDGCITMAEVGQFVSEQMLFAEGQEAGSTGLDSLRIARCVRPLRAGEGQLVEVNYKGEGTWWKARVLERQGKRAKVRWLGLSEDYPDEWVPIRHFKKS